MNCTRVFIAANLKKHFCSIVTRLDLAYIESDISNTVSLDASTSYRGKRRLSSKCIKLEKMCWQRMNYAQRKRVHKCDWKIILFAEESEVPNNISVNAVWSRSERCLDNCYNEIDWRKIFAEKPFRLAKSVAVLSIMEWNENRISAGCTLNPTMQKVEQWVPWCFDWWKKFPQNKCFRMFSYVKHQSNLNAWGNKLFLAKKSELFRRLKTIRNGLKPFNHDGYGALLVLSEWNVFLWIDFVWVWTICQ